MHHRYILAFFLIWASLAVVAEEPTQQQDAEDIVESETAEDAEEQQDAVDIVESEAAEDPILQRQKLMDNMKKKAVQPLRGMIIMPEHFDSEEAAAALAVMRGVADEAGALFPEGSDTGHDTKALPAIWSDREGFEQALAKFGAAVDAAQEADPQSGEEFKPLFMEISGTCKGCHESYRLADAQEGKRGRPERFRKRPGQDSDQGQQDEGQGGQE